VQNIETLTEHHRKGVFKFKQFEIEQKKAAMKVGTDGCLLGAWVGVEGAIRILDIGTGTGLIAIMMAQRNPLASIEGIDIDESAIDEATTNMKGSPWSDRLQAIQTSLQDFAVLRTNRYDLIVSNPPFFIAGKMPENQSLAAAKHAVSLSPLELIQGIVPLLLPEGRLGLILPPIEGAAFVKMAEKDFGFYLNKLTLVRPKKDKKVERWLIEMSRIPTELLHNELVIQYEARNDWTPSFTLLLKDFYLKM